MVYPMNVNFGSPFQGATDIANLIGKYGENRALAAKLPYIGPTAQAEMQLAQQRIPYMQAQTQGMNLQNQYYPQDIMSQIGTRNAQSALNNMYVNKPGYLAGGDVAQIQALADMARNPNALNQLSNNPNPLIQSYIRNMQNKMEFGPASGMGVGGREQMNFQNLVAKDNPQLQNDPNKIYEATNTLMSGGETLPDGTKLNFSPLTKQSLDRMVRHGSDAPTRNKIILARQADAELNVMTKSVNDIFSKHGGTSYFGVLPQQITNQFSSSERDQKALGKLIAAGAINYEMAQLRNRVAGGEPGIGATQILMKESGNMLSSHYPNLTVTARNEAQNEINRIIGQGLRAREKVGVSPSQLLPGMHKESESTQENKVSDPWGIR